MYKINEMCTMYHEMEITVKSRHVNVCDKWNSSKLCIEISYFLKKLYFCKKRCYKQRIHSFHIKLVCTVIKWMFEAISRLRK